MQHTTMRCNTPQHSTTHCQNAHCNARQHSILTAIRLMHVCVSEAGKERDIAQKEDEHTKVDGNESIQRRVASLKSDHNTVMGNLISVQISRELSREGWGQYDSHTVKIDLFLPSTISIWLAIMTWQTSCNQSITIIFRPQPWFVL